MVSRPEVVRLLLDTHIMIWAATNNSQLGDATKALIRDGSNDVFVSAISIWEAAIKFPLGRGKRDEMPFTGRDMIAECAAADFALLPVTAAHAAAVDDIPHLHGDPFDRMMVAQATVEGLRLMTSDRRLADYGPIVMTV